MKVSENKAKDVESLKMELGIKDRLVMINFLLPIEGNIVSLTIARDIHQKVKITQAEMKKHKIVSIGDGNLKWDEKGQTEKITFTNAEVDLLKEQISILDKQKKITSEILSMCLMLREQK